MPATSPEAVARLKERKKLKHRQKRLNPEFAQKERDRQRRQYAERQKSITARKRKWWKANGHRRNATRRANGRTREKLMYMYGVTPEFRSNLISMQRNKCSICKLDMGDNPHRKHMDHDHSMHGESAVRGILCHTCNVGLGHFRDNRNLLQEAMDYLDSHLAQRTVY